MEICFAYNIILPVAQNNSKSIIKTYCHLSFLGMAIISQKLEIIHIPECSSVLQMVGSIKL